MIDDVCIVVPVHNEASVVRGVVEELLRSCSQVVCVDDGSTDESAESLAGTGVHLVRHPVNLGQGAALQTGIEYGLHATDCPYFATFDSDGQHSVEDVARMRTVLVDKGLDIVLGSRFLRAQDHESLPKRKLIVLRLGVWLTRLDTGLVVTDTHNGLRVFTRRVAQELDISEPGMAHASEIARRVAEFGYRYEEVPVTIRYSDYSQAKGQSVFNSINIGTDLLFRIGRKK